ncbi:MAG: hypothetical protein ACR2LR_08680 [Hassallia sp.]
MNAGISHLFFPSLLLGGAWSAVSEPLMGLRAGAHVPSGRSDSHAGSYPVGLTLNTQQLSAIH